MGLQPINPKLRRILHDGRRPAKVSIVIAADDELLVSDDVAAQLERHSPQFKRAGDDPDPAAAGQDLEALTVAKLREYASDHDVDLAGATRKDDLIAAIVAAGAG